MSDPILPAPVLAEVVRTFGGSYAVVRIQLDEFGRMGPAMAVAFHAVRPAPSWERQYDALYENASSARRVRMMRLADHDTTSGLPVWDIVALDGRPLHVTALERGLALPEASVLIGNNTIMPAVKAARQQGMGIWGQWDTSMTEARLPFGMGETTRPHPVDNAAGAGFFMVLGMISVLAALVLFTHRDRMLQGRKPHWVARLPLSFIGMARTSSYRPLPTTPARSVDQLELPEPQSEKP